MNRLLQRQIQKVLQDCEICDPRIDAFIETVGQTYDDFEENRDFLSHTLEVVSQELTENNEVIREETKRRMQHLSAYFEETLDLQPNLIFRCRKSGHHFAVPLARGRLLSRIGIDHSMLEFEGVPALFRNSDDLKWFHLAWQGEELNFEISFEQGALACSVWLHPIFEDGHVVEILGIVSDVSHQKAADERLRHITESLEGRAKEQEKLRKVMLSMIEDLDKSRASIIRERDRANTLAHKADAANRAKSDFLATMSHEIRTPMNGVLGFTQLLQQSELNKDQVEFVSAIRSSAEALLRVINDVLDFSKIESGHMEIESSPFSLEMCIEKAIETVANSVSEKKLELIARMDANVPAAIVGDALRLRQVLVNLLSNAVKFTPEGSIKIEVVSRAQIRNQVTLEFRVSDSGIGIPEGRLDSLFLPFHQQDSSIARRFGGSGLGLAICRRLVDLMGGSIAVESQPNVGSVFTFEITAQIATDPQPLVSPVPFPSLHGKRIVLVDSHGFSRRVITELLARWGMDVRAVHSTNEEFARLQNWAPSFILLDSGACEDHEIEVIESMVSQGASLHLFCFPGEAADIVARLGVCPAATLYKPLRVSLLFNSLISGMIDPSLGGDLCRQQKSQEINCHARILLAEDNSINRKLALAALSQMGFTADVAVNGQEALDAVKANRYDIILMDIQMPGMDGLEATRRIREWERESSTPAAWIIALTANAMVGDRETCLKAGMDDYLSKPIRLQALRDAIHLKTRDVAVVSETGETDCLKALRQLAQELSSEDTIALASDFLGDLDGQLENVRSQLALQNIDEARRHAHSLKGTASIFALSGVQQAAQMIELACREGRVHDARMSLPKLLAAAQEAQCDLRDAISRITNTTYLKPMS